MKRIWKCEMYCAIWYHLYNFKNVRNTHGGVLILVKLQAETCNFTKIYTPSWVFFMFFKLCKWCQIAQHITYIFSRTYNKKMHRILTVPAGEKMRIQCRGKKNTALFGNSNLHYKCPIKMLCINIILVLDT